MSRGLTGESGNLVLTGLMGSGKTTVGRLLAGRLGRRFIDTDAHLAQQHGPLDELFAQPDADERFRELEHELVRSLAGRTGLVVATGGRTLVDPRNVALLGRSGRIVRLDAHDDELLRRLEEPGDTLRPRLVAATDRRALIESLRAGIPSLPGVLTVDTTGRSTEEVVDDVVTLLADV